MEQPQCSDILNNDRMTYVIDDVISPAQPARMVIDSGPNWSKTTFTSGWNTYMSGEDPETCFTLDPATGKGIGLNEDGEATVSTLYTITLADGLTATAAQALSGKLITLSGASPSINIGGVTYATDYIVSYNDGTDHADSYRSDDEGNATFAMPAADITISTESHKSVHFINQDGEDCIITDDFTVIEPGMTSLGYGRYVVNSDVTLNLESLVVSSNFDFLILCNGATLTIQNGTDPGELSVCDIFIYGQPQGAGTFNAKRIFVSGDIQIYNGTINACLAAEGALGNSIQIHGGTVNATAFDSDAAIFNKAPQGSIKITGGTVNATSSYGDAISAHEITLGWTNPEDRIYASSYQSSQITMKRFWNGSEFISGIAAPSRLNGKTLMGVNRLWDASNNNIADLDGKRTNALLENRTLWKDGAWNTLCLPFNVTDGDTSDDKTFSGTPLEGATVMELGNSEGCNTGFDDQTGTLTLDFVPAYTIEAGHAYIVKWETTGDPISNPIFQNVTVSNEDPDDQKVVSTDGKVQFKGTYNPATLAGNTVLYLGSGNQLYYPSTSKPMGAFRAYFELTDPSATVKQFVLNFGEDDATGIGSLTPDPSPRRGEESWFDLDGRRLSGKPGSKGIYIHNGRKEVLK